MEATMNRLVLTTDRGRGQRRLTPEAVQALCWHYGWAACTSTGYEDNGQVFIGSNYAGQLSGDQLVLDRNLTIRTAERLDVIA